MKNQTFYHFALLLCHSLASWGNSHYHALKYDTNEAEIHFGIYMQTCKMQPKAVVFGFVQFKQVQNVDDKLFLNWYQTDEILLLMKVFKIYLTFFAISLLISLNTRKDRRYLYYNSQNILWGKNERMLNYKNLLYTVLTLACFSSWPHVWNILIRELWLSKSFSGFWFCVIFIIISVTEFRELALLSAILTSNDQELLPRS